MTGIYYITNTNGKRYVGSSKDIEERWSSHKRDLNKNKHVNPKLQNAWNKCKETAFKFEIEKVLPDTLTKEELLAEEQPYLDIAKADPKRWYNINYKATCPPNATGIKRSDEFREKCRQNALGNQYRLGHEVTPEQRLAISQAQLGNKHCLGYKHTEKSKENMSKAQLSLNKHLTTEHKELMRKVNIGNKNALGHIVSEEARRKMSEGAKSVIRKPISEETRAKLSLAAKNRKPISEETRAKLSLAAKNRKPISEETRKKMSLAKIGFKHTEEAKAKIGQASKGNKYSLGHSHKHTEESKAKLSKALMGNKNGLGNKSRTGMGRLQLKVI